MNALSIQILCVKPNYPKSISMSNGQARVPPMKCLALIWVWPWIKLLKDGADTELKTKTPYVNVGKKIHFIQGTDGGLDMDAGHYSDLMLIAAAWRTVWMAAWKAAWKATWKAAWSILSSYQFLLNPLLLSNPSQSYPPGCPYSCNPITILPFPHHHLKL